MKNPTNQNQDTSLSSKIVKRKLQKMFTQSVLYPGCRKLLGALMAVGLLGTVNAWGQSDYATPYDFVTIAGGTPGSNDGTNSNAEFGFPYGVVAGTNDTLYVVDNYYNTVRKMIPVGTNWVVTTIAGTAGVTGYGDGSNQSVQFASPSSITMDVDGNLYVADSGYSILRKLTPSGTNWVSSTIAGTENYNGGNKDGTNGVAQFNYPSGIAIDVSGNLYVSDTYNNTIRRVAPVGNNWVVTTIAGSAASGPGSADGTNQVAQFNYPCGIAVDRSGNLFVADSGNYTIRKIAPVGTNWVVTTIAGTAGMNGYADGTNGNAEFFCPLIEVGPMGIAVDAGDNLYVADGGNGLIRKVSPVGTNWVTTTLAGLYNAPASSADGVGTNALFGTPIGIALDASGRVFVGDVGNNNMREGTIAAAPYLTISPAGANGVMVTWPSSGSFILQTNASLTTMNWGAYNGPVNVTNAINSVMLSSTNKTLFFRLSN
jgi:sugar lactone lactonase YvrE